MVEMLGGGEVPSGYYSLFKLASQLSSLYSTDIREACGEECKKWHCNSGQRYLLKFLFVRECV